MLFAAIQTLDPKEPESILDRCSRSRGASESFRINHSKRFRELQFGCSWFMTLSNVWRCLPFELLCRTIDRRSGRVWPDKLYRTAHLSNVIYIELSIELHTAFRSCHLNQMIWSLRLPKFSCVSGASGETKCSKSFKAVLRANRFKEASEEPNANSLNWLSLFYKS